MKIFWSTLNEIFDVYLGGNDSDSEKLFARLVIREFSWDIRPSLNDRTFLPVKLSRLVECTFCVYIVV